MRVKVSFEVLGICPCGKHEAAMVLVDGMPYALVGYNIERRVEAKAEILSDVLKEMQHRPFSDS